MSILARAFTPNSDRTTTPRRVALALSGGALTGALLVTAGYGLSFLASGIFVYLWALPLAFVAALVAWGIGLVVAGPGWWLLHTLGLRSRAVSALYGGSLCGLVGLAVAAFFPLVFAPTGEVLSTPLSQTGLPGVLPNIALFAAFGVIVGLAVARVAYGRQRRAAA